MTTIVEKKIKTKEISLVSKTKDSPEKVPSVKAVKKTVVRYIEAVGRRKTSTARVRITPSVKETAVVNGKTIAIYFPTAELQSIVNDPLLKSKLAAKFSVSVLVRGGGIHSQAEAFRHGFSRALVKYDEEVRTRLKKLGFLKRDPRTKERRKFGLKKARKAPQWSKR